MCSCNGTQEVNHAYISAANAMGFSEEAVCSIKKQHVLGATGVIELHLCLLGIEEGNLAETLSFYHHFVPPKRRFFPPFNILFFGNWVLWYKWSNDCNDRCMRYGQL